MKLWGLLIILIILFVGVSFWISNTAPAPPTQVDLKDPKDSAVQRINLRPATKEPGRVVVLNTNRGNIEFVLYEKDCPRTTQRISDLVEGGFYNGVKFPRVENWVVQTDLAKKEVPPMACELLKNLTQGKGTVGMARTSDPQSNTSVFYILTEPQPNLDQDYTNFGRVIKGMDVVMKIRHGDIIKKASLRQLTSDDKKRLDEVLTIEAERRTQ